MLTSTLQRSNHGRGASSRAPILVGLELRSGDVLDGPGKARHAHDPSLLLSCSRARN
jgi:hypothetical protein